MSEAQIIEQVNEALTQNTKTMQELSAVLLNEFTSLASKVSALESNIRVPSEALDKLIKINGREAVKEAFKEVVGVDRIKPKLGYDQLLNPTSICSLMDQEISLFDHLDNNDIKLRTATDAKKKAARLYKECETSVKVVEAEAVMSPAFYALKNDRERDAYRRTYAADQRAALANAEHESEACTLELSQLSVERASLMYKINMLDSSKKLIASIFNFVS
jgi:hypothetical protein